MKTEVLSISQFLNRGLVQHEPEPFSIKINRHFKKYGTVYKVAGITIILLMAGDFALASTGIEDGARKLYYELARIGKWVIIFKGGIDTIKAMGEGDANAVKKHFLSSVLIYLLLLGLPYGLDKVDDIFNSVSTTTSTGGWE